MRTIKKPGERPGLNIGGAEGDRTLDLRIANATLSQLSYRPEMMKLKKGRHYTIFESCKLDLALENHGSHFDHHAGAERS